MFNKHKHCSTVTVDLMTKIAMSESWVGSVYSVDMLNKGMVCIQAGWSSMA